VPAVPGSRPGLAAILFCNQ